MYSPFTKATFIKTFPEQFIRAIWNAVSWAIVLFLPQINLTHSSHIVNFFFKLTLVYQSIPSTFLFNQFILVSSLTNH